jgi:amidase
MDRMVTRSASRDVAFASGPDLAAKLASGQIRARDIVEANLWQIDALDGGMRAFITTDGDGALRAADEVDAEISRTGWRGGLHGLTVAVKDVLDVAGLITTYGSHGYRDAVPARSDCDAVARLRRAGAIIIGKTNTPPFASYLNTTSVYAGTTVSPWNPTLSSGGSSGGSAVAVACGMCVLALGTDLGGSVRGPAAWNGCYGLRPTPGRVSNAPHGWIDDSMDVIGAIGRSHEDIAAWLAAAQTWQPADESVAGAPAPRFAVSADLNGRLTLVGVVRDAFDAAVSQMTAGGFHVISRSPEVDAAIRAIRPLRALRAMATLPEAALIDVAKENPLLHAFLVKARSMSLADVVAAARARTEAWRANDHFFDEIDVLILPATQFVGMRADEQQPADLDGASLEDVLVACYATYVITVLGWPSLVVPTGLTRDGLPVGAQLVGPRGSEARLLAIATLLRQRLGWGALRPPLGGMTQ